MGLKTEKILEEALELGPIDRAELIEELFHTFEYSGRDEIDALWAEEAERRLDVFEKGGEKTIPIEDVFIEDSAKRYRER